MKNYYRHGNTIHMFDIENNVVISVTNSEYSRAIAISDNAPNAANIMNNSFSSSLNVSQRGDYPIVLSNETEFLEVQSLIKDYLVSHSINI
jgi:hypothetical protein